MVRSLEDEIDALKSAIVSAKLSHATRDYDAALTDMIAKAQKCADAFENLTSVLYGKGHEVLGWHLNGDTEPLDSFFDDNTSDEIAELRDAILEFKGSVLVQGVEVKKEVPDEQ
jgi:hypothetical protein